jgi:Flp pilus assembly protein TadD
MTRPRAQFWITATVLALATLALYWPVTGYDFVNFDDRGYVLANPHVQGGLTRESLCWALTAVEVGLWHPLTWVSHMLDCQWFGLNPGWHHLTSLLLHVANTVLLLAVLQRMTGALWPSAGVAALFALHPLHVESVAWVAERKDVLSTFFLLLTLWTYARYAGAESLKSKVQSPKSKAHPSSAVPSPLRTTATEDGSTPRSPNAKDELRRTGSPKPEEGEFPPEPGSAFDVRRSMFDVSSSLPSTLKAPLFYALSLLFFTLGLMSKPMIVTLPLVLLLLDYWPLGRFPLSTHNSKLSTLLSLLLEKLPFAVLAGLTCWITLHAGKMGGALPSAAEIPMTARLANATLSYARYLRDALWPGELALYYPFPPAFSAWAVAGAALVLAGISATALCLAGRWPYLAVGWLWYVVTLLPVIGLIQLATYSHADRYTYVPFIGLFLALTWGTVQWVSQNCRPAPGTATTAAGAVMLLLCLALTGRQVGYWQDSETLFHHALSVTSGNWRVLISLGDTLDRKGQTADAIRQYEEALRLKPDSYVAHDNLGVILDREGQTEEAVRHYQESLRVKPDDAIAHNNLGLVLLKQGRVDDAIRQYEEAIRANPQYAVAYDNLGIALARKGQTEEAIRQFREALRLRPDRPGTRRNLGYAATEYPKALGSLASSLAAQGEYAEAIRSCRAALQAQPDQEDILNNLAWLLATCPDATLRDGPEAVRLAAHACELTGYTRPLLIGTLAASQAEAGDFPAAIATAERAAALATNQHLEEVATRNRELIQLYRRGQPFHQKRPTTNGHR